MFRFNFFRFGLGVGCLIMLDSGMAGEPVDLQTQVENCQGIREPERRLACFDRLLEQPEKPVETRTTAREVNRMNLFWELDDQTHSGRGRIRTYKPLLAAPVRWSNAPTSDRHHPQAKPLSATPWTPSKARYA